MISGERHLIVAPVAGARRTRLVPLVIYAESWTYPLPSSRIFDHVILLTGVFVMVGPIIFLAWRLDLQPTAFWALFSDLWLNGLGGTGVGAKAMMWNSLVLALGVAVLKCVFSLLTAFSLVYFRLPGRDLIYGVILLSMFFPIETRILPTFAIVAEIGLLNSYAGMILPITASGLGVLILRQNLKRIPPELVEAAKIDGAGPMRILKDIVLPLSMPMIAGLFAILFVLGWNQYVWPIMINTSSQDHDTLVRGMAYAGVGSQSGVALAFLSLLPPAVVVLFLQRWLVRGLTVGIH